MDKSLHTHTLYMSWPCYLHYFGRVTFVCVILVYHLHALIIMTCSMTSFSDRNTCVWYFPCEGPNFADFSHFKRFRQHPCSVFVFDKLLNLYYTVSRVLLRPLGGVIFMTVSFYYSVLPFVPLWQKGGVIFIFDRECISKPVKWFLSQNGQRGSSLVFWPHYVFGQNHLSIKIL
jgi:hypothetical protein